MSHYDDAVYGGQFKKLKNFSGAPVQRIKYDESLLDKEIDIDGLPEGEWICRGVYRMERVFAYGRKYGRVTLENPDPAANILMPWGGAQKSVYLDLETTGLSANKGSYAFLAGLGFNGPDSFRVVHLFLAGPAWERNWLKAMEDELPDNFGFVTYNGRMFDIPMLRIRYALLGAKPVWDSSPHLDLLMLARHFYRGRMASCSLSEIEKHVLGVYRSDDDIPGSRIPALYTGYLTTSDASALRGVFYHNMLDVISLGVLQKHLSELVKMGGFSGEDMIRCGDLWDRQGDGTRAKTAWQSALDFSGSEHAANTRLAEIAKKCGEYRIAKKHLEAAAEKSDCPVDNLIDIAKIEEHYLKDLNNALFHLKQALEWLDSNSNGGWDIKRHDILFRIKRLEQKLTKTWK